MTKLTNRLFFLLIPLLVCFTASSITLGVTMNFTGHFRTEGDLYSKLNLGAPGTNPSKAYLLSRILLNPKIVIDDHFSINGQLNMLQSNRFAPSSDGTVSQGNGGYVFGDPNPQTRLNRMWLEWVSDFGVVRIGRMPVAWGYGLVYDAGGGVWDDFQTTLDRLEYRLHFGHLVGAVAYSKGGKLSTLGNENDQEFYTLFLRYDNPEEDLEWGGMYERQVRSPSQAGTLSTTGNPLYINPAAIPAASASRPTLSNTSPYPLSNNLFDIYFRRTLGYFTIGGEGTWISGNAVNLNGNNIEDSLNAFGLMFNVSYNYHDTKTFLNFLYASGDSNYNADHMNGFALLHRNRRPGLILGRELLGTYHSSAIQHGSPLYYGGPNSFSGIMYFQPGFRWDWSTSWASGFELVIARKAAAPAGEEKHLGVEIDVSTEHEFYKNFDVNVNLGYLFPGKGITGSAGQGAFGFRTSATVKF